MSYYPIDFNTSIYLIQMAGGALKLVGTLPAFPAGPTL